jgi:hypothetical protein
LESVIVQVSVDRHVYYWAAPSVDSVLDLERELGNEVTGEDARVITLAEAACQRLRLVDVGRVSVERGHGPFLLSSPADHYHFMFPSSPLPA